MSVVDAPGKFVVLNSEIAGSPVIRPKFTVGTSIWLSIHRSPCVNVVPNERLWLPLTHVSVSSITRVDASRA